MKQITAYFIVKAIIQVVDSGDATDEDIVDQVSSEADYKLSYSDEENVKVVDTELVGATLNSPL